MIKVVFTEFDFVMTEGAHQWDVGQQLKIEGLDLAEGTEVHFSTDSTPAAIRKHVSNGIVNIPDGLLEESNDITAWIYVRNETVKKIYIPITERPKPDGFVTVQETKAELEECKVKNEGLRTENEGLRTENEGLRTENEGLKEELANVQNPLELFTDISGMYQSFYFPDGYEITLDLPQIVNLSNLFDEARGVKKITLKGNLEKRGLDLTEAFQLCSQLKTLDVSEFSFRPRLADRTFSSAYGLEEIIGVIDLTYIQSATDIFDNCSSLKEIRFLPNNIPASFSLSQSKKLSANSLQSIVDGMKDLSGSSYQATLTVPIEVLVRFTDEQLIQIANKNWVVQ